MKLFSLRRLLAALLCVLLLASLAVGCGGKNEPAPAEPVEETPVSPEKEPDPTPSEPGIEQIAVREPEETEPEEELSEMAKLGLMDEPFNYFGVLVYLPLGFNVPDTPSSIYSLCWATAPLPDSMVALIAMDGETPYSDPKYKDEEHLADRYSTFEGFEGFDTFEETTIGGVEAQIATGCFYTSSGNEVPQTVVRFFFPEYWLTIRYSDNGKYTDVYRESLARLTVEGAETAGVTAPSAETAPASSVEFGDPFEYEGISICLPANFSVSSRYQDGTAQVVTEEFPVPMDQVWFRTMDAADADIATKEFFEDTFIRHFPDFEGLSVYERRNIGGVETVWLAGDVMSEDGSQMAHLAYIYMFLPEKTVYLNFTGTEDENLAGFLASAETITTA